jgi:hypothetical protein
MRLSNSREVYATWKESKHSPLEEKLNEFVAKFYAGAERTKADRAEQERRRLQWEAERKREAERQRLRWLDESNTKVFREKIDSRRFAAELRQYVADVRALLAKGECQPSAEFAKQLDWADDYVKRFDPLAVLQSEIDELHKKWAKQDAEKAEAASPSSEEEG